MKKKITALLLTAVLAAALFTGCAQENESSDNVSAQPSETSQVETTVSASAEPTLAEPTERTVTDMAGRTVTVPAEINSIGTFGSIGVLNAFVETMGAGHKICNEGSPSFVKNSSWEKYQYLFAPQIKECPAFQGADKELLMEDILAVKPDLCLTTSADLTGQLEEYGLTVIQLSWTKTEDVKECITLLGELLNKQAVAADYLTYFDDILTKAEELTRNLSEGDKKTVLYGTVSQFKQPHIIAEWWIDKAGGISVTAKAHENSSGESLVYTLEDLLKWNPEYIFVSSISEKENVLSDARLAGVMAVKNGDIYVLPRIAHVWGNRTTEQPLTIMWAINKLYPELVTDDELSEYIFYFYSHFFGYDFTDEQISEIMGD